MKRESLAPLIVFVYKRLDHTKQTLLAANQNVLAEETELYIFSDGPKTKDDEEKVNEVRAFIHAFQKDCCFRKVTVIESEKNKGLANSIIQGVTDIICRHDRVIVLEDDLVTSPYFLTFMNDCLDYYAENSKVWSIGGTTFDLPSLKEYKKDVYACYRASSWGWATWKDRWSRVDWQVSDYQEFMRSPKRKRQFRLGGQDTVAELTRQQKGEIDVWAIRWCYQESKEQAVTILPVKNLVKNIGWGGDATNCDVDRFHANIDNQKFDYTLENVEIDSRLMKEFRKYYYRPWYRRAMDYVYIKIKKAVR